MKELNQIGSEIIKSVDDLVDKNSEEWVTISTNFRDGRILLVKENFNFRTVTYTRKNYWELVFSNNNLYVQEAKGKQFLRNFEDLDFDLEFNSHVEYCIPMRNIFDYFNTIMIHYESASKHKQFFYELNDQNTFQESHFIPYIDSAHFSKGLYLLREEDDKISSISCMDNNLDITKLFTIPETDIDSISSINDLVLTLKRVNEKSIMTLYNQNGEVVNKKETGLLFRSFCSVPLSYLEQRFNYKKDL